MAEQVVTCLICCTEWRINEGRENKHLYCQECRRTSERKIDYGFPEPCVPWAGDFDLDDNPMKNGKLYRPGPRICGHKDCIQKSHIADFVSTRETKPATQEDLIAEQFSIFYRTGKSMDYSELMLALEKEKSQTRQVN